MTFCNKSTPALPADAGAMYQVYCESHTDSCPADGSGPKPKKLKNWLLGMPDQIDKVCSWGNRSGTVVHGL